MLIRPGKVRLFLKEKGFRMAKDLCPLLDSQVAEILERAAKLTKPAKTVRGREIALAIGEIR